MSDPEVLEVLRRWLRYAEEDLRTAEVLMEEDGVPRISCFHAQQAAEKSIKAIFVFLQVRVSTGRLPVHPRLEPTSGVASGGMDP